MPPEWFEAVKAFLSEHVLIAIAIAIFIEELGIPLLIPGDILMMLAGIEIARGHGTLAQVLLLEMGVTLTGATTLFYVSRGVGRSALLKYGHYIGLTHERVAYAEERLNRYPFRAVFLGRLTPGLRVLIVFACGLANVDPRRFFPALTMGAFLYLLTYTLIGMFAGDAAIHFVNRLEIPASTIASMVALIVLYVGLRSARESKRLEQPLRPSTLSRAAAGIVAAITGLVASDVARGLVGLGMRLANETNRPDAPVNAGRLISALLSWPGFLIIALTLAMVVPMIGVRRRNLPVRLVLTALLPFLLTLFVVNPFFGGRGISWNPGIGLISTLVIGLRWLTFALMLEYLDTMMYAERQHRGASPTPPPPPAS